MLSIKQLKDLIKTEDNLILRKRCFYKLIKHPKFDWDLEYLNNTTPNVIPFAKKFHTQEQAKNFITNCYKKHCQSQFWIDYKQLKFKKDLTPNEVGLLQSSLMYNAEIAADITDSNDKYHTFYKHIAENGFKYKF